jgi:hypothetical protein
VAERAGLRALAAALGKRRAAAGAGEGDHARLCLRRLRPGEATGILAIGQAAIGQLARGGFAVGQLAFGLVGWGQCSGGIFQAAGMVGVGGRRGLGGILPLVPTLGRPRILPEATPFAAIAAGGDGWIEVQLAEDALGLGLYQGGQRLPIKLDRRLQARVRIIIAEGSRRVLAHTRHVGPLLVCERIAREPLRPHEKKGFWGIAAVQVTALLVLGVVYAGAVGHDLGVFFGKLVGADAPAQVRPAARPPRRR